MKALSLGNHNLPSKWKVENILGVEKILTYFGIIWKLSLSKLGTKIEVSQNLSWSLVDMLPNRISKCFNTNSVHAWSLSNLRAVKVLTQSWHPRSIRFCMILINSVWQTSGITCFVKSWVCHKIWGQSVTSNGRTSTASTWLPLGFAGARHLVWA